MRQYLGATVSQMCWIAPGPATSARVTVPWAGRPMAGATFQPAPRSAAAPAPRPSVARAPLPGAPVGFSALIERVRAAERRLRLPRSVDRPSNAGMRLASLAQVLRVCSPLVLTSPDRLTTLIPVRSSRARPRMPEQPSDGHPTRAGQRRQVIASERPPAQMSTRTHKRVIASSTHSVGDREVDDERDQTKPQPDDPTQHRSTGSTGSTPAAKHAAAYDPDHEQRGV